MALQFIRPDLTWAQHFIVYKTRPRADAALHSLQADLALISLRPGIHLGTHNQAHNLAQLALKRSKVPSLLLKAALLWCSPVSSGPDQEIAPFPPSAKAQPHGARCREGAGDFRPHLRPSCCPQGVEITGGPGCPPPSHLQGPLSVPRPPLLGPMWSQTPGPRGSRGAKWDQRGLPGVPGGRAMPTLV